MGYRYKILARTRFNIILSWLIFPTLLLLLLFCLTNVTLAHKLSDSYLKVTTTNAKPSLRWQIALIDLYRIIQLDSNEDLKITWGEVSKQQQTIENFVRDSIQFSSEGAACTLKPLDFMVDAHSDGEYVSGSADILCDKSKKNINSHTLPALELSYSAFFENDPLHSVIVIIENHISSSSYVLSSSRRQLTIPRNTANSPSRTTTYISTITEFFTSGVLHIWTGYDHILFLVVLLIPCVLPSKYNKKLETQDQSNLSRVFFDVAAIVTAFTVAHSITLTAAALDLIYLPSTLVESAIALSVLICAGNNLIPLWSMHGYWPAFIFGLIHGFGFASLLSNDIFPSSVKLLSIISFNLGIEFGQLVIVAAFIPIAYKFRNTFWYHRAILQFGSLLIAVIAFKWFVERALGY
jgi:hypothetical protein